MGNTLPDAERASAALLFGSLPASPPPEVVELFGTAAAVLDELALRGFRLRLDVAEERRTVRVRVTEAGGRTIRELPASAALDLLAGGSADALLAGALA